MEKTKLPDYVVNSQAVENRLQEINSTIESANFHLQTLKAEGIPTDLNTLKDILKDEDSFNKWLSKAEKSYIGKIGFLPKEEKKRIHSTFSALLSRTDSARNIIHGLLFNRHGYNVLQDKEGNFYFDIEEIRKQLAESNKRYFTDKDKEYFDKLQDVYIAFKNLQAFEGKEKYIAFSNTETFNLWMRHGFNAESLIRSWEWGKMNDAYIKMLEDE